MTYRRTLLKTLAVLAPLAVFLSSYAPAPAYADDYDWCRYYGYDHDPRCVYPYGYPYPYGDFFFGDDRRFHDRHFDHPRDGDGGYDHRGFGGGGINHGGSGGRSGAGMAMPGPGRGR
jgi:hypothetical protein